MIMTVCTYIVHAPVSGKWIENIDSAHWLANLVETDSHENQLPLVNTWESYPQGADPPPSKGSEGR